MPEHETPLLPQAYLQFPWRRQPPPTKAARRAALARFDNRPTSGGGFKRRGPKPPPLSFQGDRILKERGKFEIPLSLSGVLWLLSFDMERKQLAPAGAKSSLLPRSGHSPIPQFPFSVKFSRFPFPVTEKMCKISIKRLDKRCNCAII